MSLWTTPVDQIDFPLLDAFLKGKPNEGVRLDFKAQVPKELAKVIAAFANTIGGIIILGVEESSLNEPVWPPDSTKLHILQDDSKNPRDQITNIANDAIYPPVNVQLSRLIPNTYAPGKFLIVIRVDESKDAPHAIEKNQQVFYVEKTGISTDRFTLADMDRIERMIIRRRTIEDQRDRIVDEGHHRARAHVGINETNRWMAIIPYFPSRQVCQKEHCHKTLNNFHEYRGAMNVVRIPNGAYALRRQIREPQPAMIRNVTELTTNGFCLTSSVCHDFSDQDKWIKLENTLHLIQQTLNLWRRWAKGFDIETPQLWQIRAGFDQVFGYKMHGLDGMIESHHEVIMPSFGVTRLVGFSDLADDDPSPMLADLCQEILYCFDIGPVTDLADFIKKRYRVT
jgi:Putative DNA-binding domain